MDQSTLWFPNGELGPISIGGLITGESNTGFPSRAPIDDFPTFGSLGISNVGTFGPAAAPNVDSAQMPDMNAILESLANGASLDELVANGAIPEGVIPEGFTLPNGFTIPPGFTVADDFTLPSDFFATESKTTDSTTTESKTVMSEDSFPASTFPASTTLETTPWTSVALEQTESTLATTEATEMMTLTESTATMGETSPGPTTTIIISTADSTSESLTSMLPTKGSNFPFPTMGPLPDLDSISDMLSNGSLPSDLLDNLFPDGDIPDDLDGLIGALPSDGLDLGSVQLPELGLPERPFPMPGRPFPMPPIETTEPPTTTTTLTGCDAVDAPDLPDGYTSVCMLENSVVYYKAYTSKARAYDAADQCKNDGDFLHLPVPRNEDENDFYYDLMAGKIRIGANFVSSTGGMWLGITDEESEGTWYSLNGGGYTAIGWSNWDSAYPNNVISNYAAMNLADSWGVLHKGKRKKWNITPNKHYFVYLCVGVFDWVPTG